MGQLNSMCSGCTKADCPGTTCLVWDGCIFRETDGSKRVPDRVPETARNTPSGYLTTQQAQSRCEGTITPGKYYLFDCMGAETAGLYPAAAFTSESEAKRIAINHEADLYLYEYKADGSRQLLATIYEPKF